MPQGGVHAFDRLVSTIPLPELVAALGDNTPPSVADVARHLRASTRSRWPSWNFETNLGDNFAVHIADRHILFHRLTKVDCLLPAGDGDGTSTLMAEVTFRQGDPVSVLSDAGLFDRILADLERLKFIDAAADCILHKMRKNSTMPTSSTISITGRT